MPFVDATNATAAYGQVAIWDADVIDYPQLQGSLAAATDRAVAVAVPLGPTDPPTCIEIWTPPAPVADMRHVWSGAITIGRRGARAGGWMRGDESTIKLPSGVHHIDAYVSTSPTPPARVFFVLGFERADA